MTIAISQRTILPNKMAIFQSEVRQLILKIKTSEDWQKRCKEKLVNLLRTEQIHPISNGRMKSEFTSITKQFFVQLKDTNEINKSSRSILRNILISEQNLRVNKKTFLSGNQIQTLGFQSSHHDEKQMNDISFEGRTYIQTREVQTKKFENSVRETSLFEPTKFIRWNVPVIFENMIASGNGKFMKEINTGSNIKSMKQNGTKFGISKRNFAKIIYTPIFICVLINYHEIPEFKKIMCKIK